MEKQPPSFKASRIHPSAVDWERQRRVIQIEYKVLLVKIRGHFLGFYRKKSATATGSFVSKGTHVPESDVTLIRRYTGVKRILRPSLIADERVIFHHPR